MRGVRIAVLVSGSGTILESILAAGIDVTAVLSDRPCRGLEVADAAGVEPVLIDRASFGGFGDAFERWRFTVSLTDALVDRKIDLVAMAGFGTVLDQPVHDAFEGRILNTHPALLPLYPGWHGVEDALAAGAKESGCTVHLATVKMDEGPILAQAVVPVLADDSVDTLHERIKAVERELYPATIAEAAKALRDGRSIESIANKKKEAAP